MPATIASIRRYPVKSMQGETLERAQLGENGIPGDRAWATRDERRGTMTGAKRLPLLMSQSARYAEEPKPDAPAPPAEITLADGTTLASNAPDAGARLSAAIGAEVTLWPIVPADRLEHYRMGEPENPDMEAALRELFARTADEPLPDIGKFPPDVLQYSSPPGTYFDAFPLLLLSQQSVDAIAAAAPDSVVDARRFRPNLLVDFGAERGFPENDWSGRRVRIGGDEGPVLRLEMRCPRCVMTTLGFADVPKDPGVMRKLVSENGGDLGVYARVERPGEVRAGDPIQPLD